jgi:16S rRNA (guanine1207-N2)-methyltransferase
MSVVSDEDSYYQFSSHQATVRGETFTVCTRPALGRWEEWGTPTLLLAEQARLSPGASVLHVHCGSGLAGAVAARTVGEGYVTMLDCHGVAVEAARRTLSANQVSNAGVMLSDCAQAVREQTFDSVLALLPKGRAAWEQTVLDAAQVLRVGGDLYLAGANNSGIKSAARFAESVLGNVSVLAYRGRCRVVRAVKETQVATPDSDYYAWHQISAHVNEQQIDYATRPGVFAWKQLDEGTRLLVEALQGRPLQADDRVLDVGCGSGVLTLVAARQAPGGHVVGVDVDCRAVEATRRTLMLNGISNAEVLLSDCAEAVRERALTAVVTNPPFHQEQATTYVVAGQIVRDAARLLSPGGHLYLVANAFLKYEPVVEAALGRVELLCRTGRFKVLYGTQTR